MLCRHNSIGQSTTLVVSLVFTYMTDDLCIDCKDSVLDGLSWNLAQHISIPTVTFSTLSCCLRWHSVCLVVFLLNVRNKYCVSQCALLSLADIALWFRPSETYSGASSFRVPFPIRRLPSCLWGRSQRRWRRRRRTHLLPKFLCSRAAQSDFPPGGFGKACSRCYCHTSVFMSPHHADRNIMFNKRLRGARFPFEVSWRQVIANYLCHLTSVGLQCECWSRPFFVK